jgi:small-conductance mechanosensitive channel
VGYIASKIIFNAFVKGLKKTKLPELVIDFLARFLNVFLYAIIILLFLGSLGIQVGSFFIGVSAIIGLILDFGMQDTLTNLAGDVWIAALRPIDRNEVVTVNGDITNGILEAFKKEDIKISYPQIIHLRKE